MNVFDMTLSLARKSFEVHYHTFQKVVFHKKMKYAEVSIFSGTPCRSREKKYTVSLKKKKKKKKKHAAYRCNKISSF